MILGRLNDMLNGFVKVIDILTIFNTICLSVKNIKKLNSSSRFIIYYVFVVIYAVPVLLDYVLGLPNYHSWYNASVRFSGFINSYNKANVRIIYDVFLLLSQFLILNYGRTFYLTLGRSGNANTNLSTESHYFDGFITRKMAYACLFSAALSPILCIVMGYPYIMTLWGWRDLQVFTGVTSSSYYTAIEKISYIGVVLSICIIMMKGVINTTFLERSFIKIAATVLLLANLCIESKRSILFFAIIIFMVIKIYGWGKKFNLRKYILLCLICGGIVLTYSIYIKLEMRGYSSFDEVYTNLRVDLFRDDTVKLVINSLIDPNTKDLLKYPFESYLTQLAFLFPLDLILGWGEISVPKIGFNTYLTSALSGSTIESGNRWMTTSIADEMIANFGFFGFLILPLILTYFSKKIDETDGVVQVFLIGGIVLMMMYSLNYIFYYLEFAILLKFLSRRKKKIYS